MTLPSTIKIGAITYTINVLDSLNSQDKVGELDRTTNEISISPDLSNEQKWLTLWHEIIHACNGELTEEIVEGLSVCLHQVGEQIMDLTKTKKV